MSTIDFDKINLVNESIGDASDVSIEQWTKHFITFLEAVGATVEVDQNIVYDFVAECDYLKGRIKIGRLEPREMLLAIAHEAGHWFSHLRLNHGAFVGTTFEREIWAFLHGWWIIRKLGADQVITKEEWIAYHGREIAAYAAYKQRQKPPT